MPKLLVGRTAISGINLVFSHAGKAVRVAWFPYLIFVVTELVYYSLIESAAQEFNATYDGTGEESIWVELWLIWQAIDWQTGLQFLVSCIAYALLTAGWIRFILRGETARTQWFGGREIKLFMAYVLWTVWLIVMAAMLWFVTMAAATFGGWPLAVIVATIVAFLAMLATVRLLMVFPMIAVNQGMGWVGAWRMTKGNGWRLLAGFFLAFLLTLVIVIVINIPLQLLPEEPSLAFSVPLLIDVAAQSALSVFFLMVMLGSLAEAYRQLNGPGMVVPEEVLQVFDD